MDDDTAALHDDPALNEDKDEEDVIREGNGKSEGNDLADDPRSEHMDDEEDPDAEHLSDVNTPEETDGND